MSGTAQRCNPNTGVCGCGHHSLDWLRPEHWTAGEVDYLHQYFGRLTDEQIATHLGRTVVGIRLKAKRLRLRKRSAGFTGHEVAALFGVDDHVPARWHRAGLLRAHPAGFTQGSGRVLLTDPAAVERFIREHGEYVDVDKMPESWYRDLAQQQRWYSLVEVERLTGHDPASLSLSLRRGVYAGRQRWGTLWMVPASELPRIAANTTRWRRGHLDQLQLERAERLHERKRRRIQGDAA